MKGFVKISKYAGMREDLVQAGGGNSSFKITEDRMVVKASGFQLADITEKDGYAVVNPQIIQEALMEINNIETLTEDESKVILNAAFVEGRRPSIETFLHAVSGKYTLHTHPIVVNALTCRKEGMKVLQELFTEALLVPYATPGAELAKEYFKMCVKQTKMGKEISDIVFLQNHGLVVSANTAEEVIEKTEFVLQKIENYLEVNFDPYHDLTKIWRFYEEKIIWKISDRNILRVWEKKNEMWNHAFCPDCIVFLGKKLLELSEDFGKEDIINFSQLHGQAAMLLYRDNLYVIADSVKKAMEIQSVMSFSAQVMEMNDGFECNLLSDNEQNYLLNWEMEQYRRLLK